MNKDFNRGLEAGLQILAAENDRNQQEIRRLREGTLWGKLSNFFSKKRKNYDVKVVYNKPDLKFAEEIRKFLEAQGHLAYAFPVDSYRQLPSTVADYTIFVNDCDQINRKGEKIVTDQFGCFMSVSKSQMVISYDEKAINDGNINEFIEYYNDKIKLNQDMDKQQLKVEQVKEENFTAEAFEKKLQKIMDRADALEAKQHSGLATLYLLSHIPLVFASFGVAVPMIISEEIFKNMSTELKNQRHRKKYIPICQKQIVQLALCEYLK